MRIGMIGLGKMGANMSVRLARGGHEVIAYDLEPGRAKALGSGIDPAETISELLRKVPPPRAIWLMVPAGLPVDSVLSELRPGLVPGDVVVDGGNSHWKDSVRRSAALVKHEVHLLDAGTSGGVWGLDAGYCLMVGGHASAVARVESALKTLAQADGYAHVGPSGAGHFAKMVHNGIEYGLMQAYAEGFEIMEASGFEYDHASIARLWGRGSVVRSWLLELLETAFRDDARLGGVKGWVDDTGEGRWCVAEAIERNVPAPVITASLLSRLRSRQTESFGAKVVAALRRRFGGHDVRKA